ncbi:phosphoribosyltransferase [Thiohalocapsa sp.]|uniref:phosphoribosyltransferase n=1 Tax=Thiohalocapsa sp. TaxID=2497641 RepID=UPI0025E4F93C|nr:phosphoribosyltransferase [Thiohalocapsa sp.]
MSAVQLPFSDRTEAGRLLASALHEYRGRDDVLVLALPRGGVPVAAEVAAELDAPLDLMLVRKLGVPGQPELAMGAIATGGVQVLNPDIVSALGISEHTIDRVADVEGRELARRTRAYRGERPPPRIQGSCVILIDDGLATGATMRAAVSAARTQRPGLLVVAVPVASADALDLIEPTVDDLVCLAAPEPFWGVGRWYAAFPQTSDAEVRALLADAAERAGAE